MFKDPVMSVHRPQVNNPCDNSRDGKLDGHAGHSLFVQLDSKNVWFYTKANASPRALLVGLNFTLWYYLGLYSNCGLGMITFPHLLMKWYTVE